VCVCVCVREKERERERKRESEREKERVREMREMSYKKKIEKETKISEHKKGWKI
jgi:hypothetical protein